MLTSVLGCVLDLVVLSSLLPFACAWEHSHGGDSRGPPASAFFTALPHATSFTTAAVTSGVSSTTQTSSVSIKTNSTVLTPATTFSEATASTAAASTSGVSIHGGQGYINFSTVPGYFLQDLNSTNASTFDFTAANFGLINQTYANDCGTSVNLTQWQRFDRVLYALNQESVMNVVYKLLFIGRHGEGYHNAEQSYVGTPAWNCYWAELDGNATATWSDAALTPNGVGQAIHANTFWESEIQHQKIQVPQSYYVSPLTRCLQTANYTYSNLSLPAYYPFIPTVKEYFREGISIHTCDRRSNRTYIHESFPTFNIEQSLTEYDEEWNGITSETSSAQDYRSKIVLDQVFVSDPASVISITTHSGEAASLLRVLGHIPFSLNTGAIIPVLVKAETVRSAPTATTTVPWQPSSWCTNGPPVTSLSTGAAQCVCSNGIAPVATLATVSRAT